MLSGISPVLPMSLCNTDAAVPRNKHWSCSHVRQGPLQSKVYCCCTGLASETWPVRRHSSFHFLSVDSTHDPLAPIHHYGVAASHCTQSATCSSCQPRGSWCRVTACLPYTYTGWPAVSQAAAAPTSQMSESHIILAYRRTLDIPRNKSLVDGNWRLSTTCHDVTCSQVQSLQAVFLRFEKEHLWWTRDPPSIVWVSRLQCLNARPQTEKINACNDNSKRCSSSLHKLSKYTQPFGHISTNGQYTGTDTKTDANWLTKWHHRSLVGHCGHKVSKIAGLCSKASSCLAKHRAMCNFPVWQCHYTCTVWGHIGINLFGLESHGMVFLTQSRALVLTIVCWMILWVAKMWNLGNFGGRQNISQSALVDSIYR